MTEDNVEMNLEKEVVAKLEEYRSWSDNLSKDEIQSLDERKPSKRKPTPSDRCALRLVRMESMVFQGIPVQIKR